MYKLYDFRYKMAVMMTFSFFVLTLMATAAHRYVSSGGSCRNAVYNVQNLIQHVTIIRIITNLIHFMYIYCM